jgi:hypothetical protein
MSIPQLPITRSLRVLACLAAAGALGLSASSAASAATMTFGSSLSVPATLDTSADLDYPGYGIPTISGGQAIVYHINHDAADTALWNTALASGSPTAPASGQVIGVSLEGCAQPAAGGPPPLTQIHFQDLVPQGGGGVKANATSQAFNIPVCGGGVGESTVTNYQPTDFCVSQGDYVDFNDEGGWAPEDPLTYPDGVPYKVIGSVPGSTMDSFVANNGAGNGAVFSPGVKSDRNGFATNDNEELMLEATLATGPDATSRCPGGTKPEGYNSSPGSSSSDGLPLVTLPKQDDGVNRRGLVQIALYCHAVSTCVGTLTIHSSSGHGAHTAAAGQGSFSVPSLQTGKVTVHLSAPIQRLVHRLAGTLTVEVTVLAASASHPWIESIALRGWRAG